MKVAQSEVDTREASENTKLNLATPSVTGNILMEATVIPQLPLHLRNTTLDVYTAIHPITQPLVRKSTMLRNARTFLTGIWKNDPNRTLGPYLVIISFSSTARILLKLPHGKPLFTLRMLRRTRDTKLL